MSLFFEIGTRLAVLETMKMQHDILAQVNGTVLEVFGQTGEQAAAGDLLMEIEITGVNPEK